MGKRGPVPKNKLPTTPAIPMESAISPASTKRDANDIKKDEARERRWKAEDALRTMEQAEKHKKDKQLMKDIKQLAREKVKDLKGLC
jgi:hypothetical protein